MPMPVPNTVGDLAPVAMEEALIETWRQQRTFQQSIEMRHDGAPFIFLEGPPTANGKPGIHHVVARTFKDLVCRWKAMEGLRLKEVWRDSLLRCRKASKTRTSPR